MTHWLAFLALTMTLAIPVAGACVLYFWTRRTRYTRERFAFVALSATVALTLAYLSTVLTQATPWSVTVAAFTIAIEGTFAPPPPSGADYALLLIVYMGALWFMNKLYHDWGWSP